MIQHPCILKSNIQHQNMEHISKRGLPPFFHSDTNLVLGNSLVHPLEYTPVQVVTVELFSCCSWIYFPSTLFKRQTNLLVSENLHRSFVVQTNHCQSCTAFFAWCALSKVSTFLFCGCLSPKIVHLLTYFCWGQMFCDSKMGKHTKACDIIIHNSWR